MEQNDKVNILLVDDQPAKLLSYEVVLRDLDENLIQASSATEALELKIFVRSRRTASVSKYGGGTSLLSVSWVKASTSSRFLRAP